MTAPVMHNDVEDVQNYSAQLTSDADSWREIATSATVVADQLRADAAAWTSEWVPESSYGDAVSTMCSRMTELASMANGVAAGIDTRSQRAGAASIDIAETDEASAASIDGIEIFVQQGVK